MWCVFLIANLVCWDQNTVYNILFLIFLLWSKFQIFIIIWQQKHNHYYNLCHIHLVCNLCFWNYWQTSVFTHIKIWIHHTHTHKFYVFSSEIYASITKTKSFDLLLSKIGFSLLHKKFIHRKQFEKRNIWTIIFEFAV